jgi:hypothetical protein
MAFSLSSFAVVGFSGSRSVVPPAVAAALSRVAPSACVVVGCAEGVDRAARSGWGGALEVVQADRSLGRGGFARRSAAVVARVAEADGCWVCFPSGACPEVVAPSSSASRCFCGGGSGTWASAALAIGLGCPVLCWLPEGVACPGGWGFIALGRGWFVSVPVFSQPALF